MRAHGLVLIIAVAGCKKKPVDEPEPMGAPATGHSVTKLATDDAGVGDGGGGAATSSASILDGVTAISAGSERACAIAADDKLWCWAPGEPATKLEAPSGVLAIANAACALLDDGTLWCWPNRITVASGNDKGAGQVGASATDVCAAHRLFVWCWKPGDDRARVQFDWGGVDRLVVGAGKVCTVVTGAVIECRSTSAETERPQPLAEPQDVAMLAVGGTTWCAVHTNGRVECWTDPRRRVEIAGVSGATLVAVGPAGDACAVIGGGAVACWKPSGGGDAGSTKVIAGLAGITGLAVGAGYGCAVGGDHRAMCWDASGTAKPVARAK